MNSKLSIVILFLNEGNEVRKTVQSIIDSITCRDDIEIILLDDASDDNYNYKQIDNYSLQNQINQNELDIIFYD